MRLPCISLPALLLLAACSGDSGTNPPPTPPPPPPFVLTITGPGAVTGVRSTNVNGQPVITCDYTISAAATGGAAGEAAMWEGARLEWRHTPTGSQYVDSLTVTQVVDWFGSDRVVTGHPATATRRAWWDAPFTLAHVLRYRTASGELRSGTAFLTCE